MSPLALLLLCLHSACMWGLSVVGALDLRNKSWISLVVQWFRICLLMQGTWVQSLVKEDSKAMLQLLKPRAYALQQEKTLPGDTYALPLERSPHSLQLEKAHIQ